MSERPAEVPPDWVEVDCANPDCDRTVWVPPFAAAGTVEGTPIAGVCSSGCALQLVEGSA